MAFKTDSLHSSLSLTWKTPKPSIGIFTLFVNASLYIPFCFLFLLNKCSKHMLFHLRQTVFILFLAVQINLHIRVCCQFLFIRVIVAHVLFRPAICFIFFRQFEIKDIEVYLDAPDWSIPGWRCFNPYAILRWPVRCSFHIFSGQSSLTTGSSSAWSPCPNGYHAITQQLHGQVSCDGFFIAVIRIKLPSDHMRFDLALSSSFFQLFALEIGIPDRFDFALFVCRLFPVYGILPWNRLQADG